MLVMYDYLIVGAGATGLAFADAVAAAENVQVTVVDRQPAPGGHWLQAYPFLRLHMPSAYYGVNSLALGEDSIDEAARMPATTSGQPAAGPRVLRRGGGSACATGQVRVLTGHEHSAPEATASRSKT